MNESGMINGIPARFFYNRHDYFKSGMNVLETGMISKRRLSSLHDSNPRPA
ncbi:hypothetical protein [Bacillus sp. CH30_1T]|uniref:hypothetical protein n=1 Tax=Bacillus sp. CH30_1T TaxID=2604836 RepID=UPI00165D4EA5|nr:hypothetical protein [Bacillus sp. CH30_1T]